MNKRAVAAALLFTAIIVVSAVSQTSSKTKTAKTSPLVTRGKYLVVNVGLCGDCHTPMDKTGKPLKGQSLQGAPLFFKPTVPVPGWMAVAPGIAGLPGWTEEQGITFFTTGKKPDGAEAAPPMPAFRFNKADASAIVAYLKAMGPDANGK